MIQLVRRLLSSLLSGDIELTPQDEPGETYYPKSTPEDGLFDREDSTGEIYNHIRAVTFPFGGAFGYLNDDKDQHLTIWRAIPFDQHLLQNHGKPGRILDVF